MISHRLNAERLTLLGWSRAILLQLAHPLIAAGVAQHSTFRRGPVAAATRLHQTVQAMLALTFGDAARQETALEGIRAIHRRVHGTLSHATGIFAPGTAYSAEDPDLVLWVHATLLDSIPLVYSRLIGTLSSAELDEYCIETASVASALGARDEEVPRRWMDLRTYMDRALASGVLTVGADARAIVSQVLKPPFGPISAPLTTLNRRMTIGMLPSAIREGYGFGWSVTDQRRLESACRRIRRARGMLPAQVALWRAARRRQR